MSSELTDEQLVWYELGLRLTQAQIVFSYDVDERTKTDMLFPEVLNRLLAAVLRMPETNERHESLSEEAEEIRWCCRCWRETSTEDDAVQAMHHVRSSLNRLSMRLNLRTEQLNQRNLHWFEAGCEIANGHSETQLQTANRPSEGDGPPDGVDPENGTPQRFDRTRWLEIEFPTSSSVWTWRRRCRLDELLALLSRDRETLFPRLDGSSDELAFPAEVLPPELVGWESIELGLRRLQELSRSSVDRRPYWDSQGRTLWIGNQEAKRYERRADRQFQVLEEFARCRWRSEIESPFSCPKQRDDTIQGLNQRLDRQLMRFYGYGTSSIRWIPGPEAFPQRQSGNS